MGVRDPVRPLRKCLKSGLTLREIARQTGVPVMTLSDWLRKGAPKSVRQWLQVMGWVDARQAGKKRGN